MYSHNYGMAVGIAEKRRNQSIRGLWIFQDARPEAKRENTRKGPKSLNHGNELSFVDTLAEPSDAEEGEDSDSSARYR